MNVIDLINWLSVIVLIGLIIALGYVILVLARANRLLSKLDHASSAFRGFVEQVMPAIINISTVSAAVHKIIEKFAAERGHSKTDSKK